MPGANVARTRRRRTPHVAGEQEQRIVDRILNVDTHRRSACHGFAIADKFRQ
jgi:hypothetical protein